MSIGEVVKTTPTLGFNVESVNYKKTHFTVWDIGGKHSPVQNEDRENCITNC